MDDLTYIYSLIPQPTESLEPAWVPSVKGYREDRIFEAVEACRKHKIYILGGDIYCRFNGGICNTGDNWHTDPDRRESFDGLAERSYVETINYLRMVLDPLKANDDRPYLIGWTLMSRHRKYSLSGFNLPRKVKGVAEPTEKLNSRFNDSLVNGYTEELAMEAIDSCERLSVVVEGGHIHSYRYGKLHAEGEFWNSVPQEAEPFESWSKRSIDEAREFVSSYRDKYRLKDNEKMLVEIGFLDFEAFSKEYL
jgi:hypothetical protein